MCTNPNVCIGRYICWATTAGKRLFINMAVKKYTAINQISLFLYDFPPVSILIAAGVGTGDLNLECVPAI